MTGHRPTTQHSTGEEGYLLLGLVVACFLLLLVLGVAAPRVAKQLERDREVESEMRAQQYVRAIQLFYRKNNRFPTSIDELLGKPAGGGMSLGGSTPNVKYLRQQYKDPLTGDDYRLIHFGEAKTEVKGFFGEPLQGAPIGNLGSAAGMVSNLGGGAAGTFGASGSTGTTGANGSSGASGSQAGSGSSFGSSSTSATAFQGSKGMILGVGSNAKGHGLVEWNGSENIEDWEFLYDPRVEILKAKVSLFGGTPAASGTGSLGNGFAPVNGTTGLSGATGSNGFSTPSVGTTPSTGSTTNSITP